MDTELSKLGKDELLTRMENIYAAAKPIQDQMADKSLEILKCSTEVFRRLIVRLLPEVKMPRTRIVMELSCSLNCMGKPAHELNSRINKFAAEGVKIVRVDYDEMLCRYLFHAEATGDSPSINEGS